jgi:hypothetical protein
VAGIVSHAELALVVAERRHPRPVRAELRATLLPKSRQTPGALSTSRLA